MLIGMDPRAVRSRIDEGYMNGGPYSWAREYWRNFHQQVTRRLEALGVEQHTAEAVKTAFGYMPQQRFDILNVHVPVDDNDVPFPHGALKRVIWNTGPHMTETEIREYFTQVGAGHGDLVTIDNPLGDRHAGARESSLPWNPAGVVVVSYHPTHLPDGAKAWMAFDEDAQAYRLRELPTGIETLGVPTQDVVTPATVADDYGLDWMEVINQTEVKDHGGVLFAFLGGNPLIDDINGVDESRFRKGAEAPTGIATFLLDNVARTLGEVTVLYPLSSATAGTYLDRHDADGRQHAFESRSIQGLVTWETTGVAGSRTRKPIPGTHKGTWRSEDGRLEIDWTLLPEPIPRSMAPYRGEGHIVVRYRDDLHPFSPSKTTPDKFEVWGVSEVSVWKRLRLVLRPTADPRALDDGWHVRQNPSRSGVVAYDGTEVYWRNWADEFAENMPDPIDSALKSVAHRKPDYAKRKRELLERLVARDMAKLAAGTRDLAGNPLPGDAGAVGEGQETESERRERHDDESPGSGGADEGGQTREPGRRRRKASEGATHTRTRRKQYSDLPDPVFLEKEEWESQGYEHLHFVRLVMTGSSLELRFNKHHELYREQLAYFRHWRDNARKGSPLHRVKDEVIEEAVQMAYWSDAASRYYSALRRLGASDKFKVDELRDDPIYLTIGAEGYQNVDSAVKTAVGGK